MKESKIYSWEIVILNMNETDILNIFTLFIYRLKKAKIATAKKCRNQVI